ncbi:hypothetical protein HKX48_006327 [Thoreauomyces humboldtii]|nr:hypothetical protein HKX48_006327 [Thoreauomyces humboldtii]
MSLIGVTGASGKLGSSIITELLKIVPPHRIVALARDTSKVSALLSQGAQVRQADFAKPSTLAAVFQGLDKLVIKAGVKVLYYTSQVAASPTSAVAFGTQHAATETDLEASGIPFVSLRNGFYTSSLDQMTASSDDMSEIAAVLTRAWGKPIQHVVVTPEEFVQEKVWQGVPAMFANFFVGAYKAMKDAEFARVDPALAKLLGRKLKTAEEWRKQAVRSKNL